VLENHDGERTDVESDRRAGRHRSAVRERLP